jgi:dihydrofolate reductase
MILSIIAAIGKNNELGKGSTLLWHMPADMKHFRETTSGHSVIMGRKTFESLKGPLPNRRNIIVTRDENYKKEGIEATNSLEEAIEKTEKEEEVFIIGGGELYKQSISFAQKLYITKIDAEDIDADTHFPAIGKEWQEISRKKCEPDEKNPQAYTFLIYERK